MLWTSKKKEISIDTIHNKDEMIDHNKDKFIDNMEYQLSRNIDDFNFEYVQSIRPRPYYKIDLSELIIIHKPSNIKFSFQTNYDDYESGSEKPKLRVQRPFDVTFSPKESDGLIRLILKIFPIFENQYYSKDNESKLKKYLNEMANLENKFLKLEFNASQVKYSMHLRALLWMNKHATDYDVIRPSSYENLDSNSLIFYTRFEHDSDHMACKLQFEQYVKN